MVKWNTGLRRPAQAVYSLDLTPKISGVGPKFYPLEAVAIGQCAVDKRAFGDTGGDDVVK